MRRALIVTAVAGALAAGAAPAAGALSLTPGTVRVVSAEDRPADRQPVFAARAGSRCRFEVGYEVAGARRVGTGHLFVYERAATGERMGVASKSFPPEPAGSYTETHEMTIPPAWAPGVYRLRWTLTARHPRLASVRARGAHVFLVLGPLRP